MATIAVSWAVRWRCSRRHSCPAAECVRGDAVDRKAAQVEQTRGVRYRVDLNIADVRTLEQARGLTLIRNCL